MGKAQDIQATRTTFSQVLEAAARLPGVRIDRDSYLRLALKRHCSDEQIDEAINTSPAAAGVPISVLTEVAKTSIKYESRKVTTASALAGLPGGWALVGTVPADLAQYFGHMLRIAQKLAYIYSWPDLFGETGEEIDEATENVLTLFVGVMFGVQMAQSGVTKVSQMMAGQVLKKLPQQALTKGTIYPIVKRVATKLGAEMTKKIFAGGVAKAIPFIGALTSGGLTYLTFTPMAWKLQAHLASLELTKPGHRHPTAAEASQPSGS